MNTSEAGFHERGDNEFLFDFDQFERMDQAGIFSGIEGHVELIEGKILQMAPASTDHGGVSASIVFAIMSALRELSPQPPLRVLTHATLKIGDYSAPEPDVCVMRAGETQKYAQAEQVVLVIEVSISTRGRDLNIKAPLYARAGVPELWLVEPENQKVSVFRDPRPDGTWGSTTVLEGDGAAASPLFAPQISIPLTALF
jgi:Uma2 family endonuclease